MNTKLLLIIPIITLLFSACSVKRIHTTMDNVDNTQRLQRVTRTNNYNHFRYKPVIGTRQDDTKVLIDMGQFAKIWIKNFKNGNNSFTASHDVIIKIREPDFIAGEEVPRHRRRTVKRTYGSHSFSYRSSDLLHNNSSINTQDVKTKDIKKYLNNYAKAKKEKKLDTKKQQQMSEYDKKLKEYLQQRRGK